MNDNSREEGPGDEPPGLDPDLLQLFDEALAHGSSGPPIATHDEAFVDALLARLHRARRARLLARSIITAAIIVLSAFLAPYVAQATLTVMGSAALYPVGCGCAALIAWRSAGRRFN
jgi:hypothetical protein